MCGRNGSADRTIEPFVVDVEGFSSGLLDSATGTTHKILEVKRSVFEEVTEEMARFGVQQAAD